MYIYICIYIYMFFEFFAGPSKAGACSWRNWAEPRRAEISRGPRRYAIEAVVLGGSWDLVTTYNWAYNPTYNPP